MAHPDRQETLRYLAAAAIDLETWNAALWPGFINYLLEHLDGYLKAKKATLSEGFLKELRGYLTDRLHVGHW